MNLTIDLSEAHAAAGEAQARAAHISAERYLARIVERALGRQRHDNVRKLAGHLDQMAARLEPATTVEKMEAALAEALSQVRPRRAWQT